MKPALLVILFITVGLHARAQIGESSIGSATVGNSFVGSSRTIGKTTLPVCTPKSYSCDNAATSTYIFTGCGYWNIAKNWENELIPPAVLPAGYVIIIAPAYSGECILNVRQTIVTGARITVLAGKKFTVVGGVLIE